LEKWQGDVETMPVSKLRYVLQQRSLQIALLLWVLICVAALALCHGSVPLPGLHAAAPVVQVISSSISILLVMALIGLVALLARGRPMPDLAQRAPDRAIALRETIALWIYGAVVILLGRWIGLHYFGDSIALHLNGSLVGASRVQSPAEV
jgi:hypothetical protein